MKFHIVKSPNHEEFLQDLEVYINENNILDSSHQFYYSSGVGHYSVLIMWK